MSASSSPFIFEHKPCFYNVKSIHNSDMLAIYATGIERDNLSEFFKAMDKTERVVLCKETGSPKEYTSKGKSLLIGAGLGVALSLAFLGMGMPRSDLFFTSYLFGSMGACTGVLGPGKYHGPWMHRECIDEKPRYKRLKAKIAKIDDYMLRLEPSQKLQAELVKAHFQSSLLAYERTIHIR